MSPFLVLDQRPLLLYKTFPQQRNEKNDFGEYKSLPSIVAPEDVVPSLTPLLRRPDCAVKTHCDVLSLACDRGAFCNDVVTISTGR